MSQTYHINSWFRVYLLAAFRASAPCGAPYNIESSVGSSRGSLQMDGGSEQPYVSLPLTPWLAEAPLCSDSIRVSCSAAAADGSGLFHTPAKGALFVLRQTVREPFSSFYTGKCLLTARRPHSCELIFLHPCWVLAAPSFVFTSRYQNPGHQPA